MDVTERERRKQQRASQVEQRELIKGVYGLDPFKRLDQDTARSTLGEMSREEVRAIVDMYYDLQSQRIRMGNRFDSLKKADKNRAVADWFLAYFDATEKNMGAVLSDYAQSKPIGRWAMSIRGIGPTLAAGLIAHIDITKAATAGAIWRFAGLDPSTVRLSRTRADEIVKNGISGRSVTEAEVRQIANDLNRRFDTVWRLGHDKNDKITKTTLAAGLARRPYNESLKVLSWKISDQLCVKHRTSRTKARPDGPELAFYGPLFDQRLDYETRKNEAGDYSEKAKSPEKLGKVGTDTKSYAAYKEGRLGEAEIKNRSRRWTVKLFLAHYQHVAYVMEYGKAPPNPYAFSILGHSKIIGPPNWPFEGYGE